MKVWHQPVMAQKHQKQKAGETALVSISAFGCLSLVQLVMKQMTCMHQELYSNDDALRWCSQVAGALAYLHNSRPQVIHRDLKLENVLLKGVKEKGDRSAQTAKLSVGREIRALHCPAKP